MRKKKHKRGLYPKHRYYDELRMYDQERQVKDALKKEMEQKQKLENSRGSPETFGGRTMRDRWDYFGTGFACGVIFSMIVIILWEVLKL